MLETIIINSIAFIYLLTGSISDIQRREVSDWANYGLIASGVAVNMLFSLGNSDWSYTLNSLIGLGIFFLLALAMFYTGQWGGGDSKMLMGLGALYGVAIPWQNFSLQNLLSSNYFMIAFMVNILVAGAVYGIIWSIIIAIINRKKFGKQFKKITNEKNVKHARIALYISVVIMIISALLIPNPGIKLTLFILAIMIFGMFWLWLVIKSVENSCMFKLVTPDKLTEGDWIAQNIRYKGKYITGPKDLGIEKKQINFLIKLYKQKKLKKVMVKEGIPFVPSFFLGWILTLILGNIFSFM